MSDDKNEAIPLPGGGLSLKYPIECPGCHRMAMIVSLATGRTTCLDCAEKPPAREVRCLRVPGCPCARCVRGEYSSDPRDVLTALGEPHCAKCGARKGGCHCA